MRVRVVRGSPVGWWSSRNPERGPSGEETIPYLRIVPADFDRSEFLSWIVPANVYIYTCVQVRMTVRD